METIGERIKKTRKAKGLNQLGFAKLIGLKNAIDVSRLEQNQRKHTSTILVNISNKCNISLNWLMAGEGSMYKANMIHESQVKYKIEEKIHEKIPVRPVPVLNSVPAGFPETPIDDNIVDWVSIPMDLKDPQAFALIITGKSMYPIIDDGEIVIISPKTKVLSGQIGAFRVNNDVTIKRLLIKGSKTYLISENPEHPPFILNDGDELIAIGRAVYQVKKIK